MPWGTEQNGIPGVNHIAPTVKEWLRLFKSAAENPASIAELLAQNTLFEAMPGIE